MARSRNIKPGFFTNDVLGELPPLARLLFAGLWTICDRAGRCEDRPKKIKIEVLPYDTCDADELLSMLANAGFLTRYEVDGVRVIQVLAWEKHQNPHVKEGASQLPAPDKHSASTVQAPGKQQPIPEQAGLIPDSLNLIPDPRDTAPDVAPPAVKSSKASKPGPVSTEELVAAGFNPESAADFIAHKSSMKAPLTARAWKDHLSESAKAGWTPQQAAEKVMAKNWKGFEAKYVANERVPFQGGSSPPPAPIVSPAIEKTRELLKAQELEYEQIARNAEAARQIRESRGLRGPVDHYPDFEVSPE